MTERRETSLPKPCLCPQCGKGLDTSTAVEDADMGYAPEPGDYSMCIHCATILVYRPDLMLRRAEAEDFATMPTLTLTTLMRAQQAQAWALNLHRPKPESKN